jgi:uncharacterized protein
VGRPARRRPNRIAEQHRNARSCNLPFGDVIRSGIMTTVLLLICSNVFMTIAWYGHLKYRNVPMLVAITVSWLIAFAEYCFQVPANRIGYGEFTAFQLKIIQEVITLCVFVVFAWVYLGERIKWNHAVSFLFVVGAVTFAFWGKL